MNKTRYEAIVSLKIDGKITNDVKAVQAALKLNLISDIELVKKGVVELMSAFDLGPNWDNLAKARTLFYLKNDEPITVQQYEQEINKAKE